MMRFSKPRWAYPGSDDFVDITREFVAAQGGAAHLFARMHGLGMSAQARSWSCPGVRVPIYSEQVHQLFGTGVLRAEAARLDMPPREFVRRLAQSLPQSMSRLGA